MDFYEIFSIGDAEMMYNALQGVAMIFGTGDYGNLIRSGFILGAFIITARYFTDQRLNLQHILAAIVVYEIMFTPKVLVHIEDVYTGEVRTVANIPLGVALPIAVVSTMGVKLAELFETAFMVSSDASMLENGYIDSLNILLKMRGINTGTADSDMTMNGDISKSIRDYIETCILFDLELPLGPHEVTQESLQKADDLWAAMKTTFINRDFIVTLPSVPDGQQMSCKDAYVAIDNYIKSMFKQIARPLMAFIEMFAVAISPIAAFLVTLGPMGILMMGRYIQLMLWIALWGPVMAICNMYVTVAAGRAVEAMATNAAANGTSLASMVMHDEVYRTLETWVATGGMLAASVPALSLMLVYGGSVAATNLAGRMTAAASTSVKPERMAPEPVSIDGGMKVSASEQYSPNTGLAKANVQQPSVNFASTAERGYMSAASSMRTASSTASQAYNSIMQTAQRSGATVRDGDTMTDLLSRSSASSDRYAASVGREMGERFGRTEAEKTAISAGVSSSIAGGLSFGGKVGKSDIGGLVSASANGNLQSMAGMDINRANEISNQIRYNNMASKLTSSGADVDLSNAEKDIQNSKDQPRIDSYNEAKSRAQYELDRSGAQLIGNEREAMVRYLAMDVVDPNRAMHIAKSAILPTSQGKAGTKMEADQYLGDVQALDDIVGDTEAEGFRSKSKGEVASMPSARDQTANSARSNATSSSGSLDNKTVYKGQQRGKGGDGNPPSVKPLNIGDDKADIQRRAEDKSVEINSTHPNLHDALLGTPEEIQKRIDEPLINWDTDTSGLISRATINETAAIRDNIVKPTITRLPIDVGDTQYKGFSGLRD